MGARFEVEIVSEKFIPQTTVLKFLRSIDIQGEFEQAIAISNWEYKNQHEIPIYANAIESEISEGHIVLIEGKSLQSMAFGVIFYRNNDNTFSSSIWFDVLLRRELNGCHNESEYIEVLNDITKKLSAMYSFNPLLIAMGTEIFFHYKNSVADSIAKSSGVQKWIVRQEDGTFFLL